MSNHARSIGTSVEDRATSDTASIPGVVTATLVGFTRSGAPLIRMLGNAPGTDVLARSCVSFTGVDVGRQVVIVADAGNPDSPIVIGVVQPPANKTGVMITADGQSIAVHADSNIVLKCGDASISLSRDGKIVIRGKYVVTHASGVNRIRGGSVQLN